MVSMAASVLAARRACKRYLRANRLSRNHHAMTTSIDEIDCALLELLQERGDVANIELARRVGLSAAATLRRVQRLRAAGVVEGVRAVVSGEHVGLGVEAFVLVTLAAHGARSEAAFARALTQLPNVLRADSVAGDEDALLHVAVATPADLHRLLLALKRAGASHVRTILRLQAIKPPSAVPVQPTTG
jgi:Lrp/AsnC family transcriptional regulator, leucine-responsive regulatory protein